MKKLLLLFPLFALLAACSSNPANKKIVRSGAAIAYNRYGKGDTTLLFVHGWCINKEYWKSQVDFFSPRYTVVTIDLPGFGESAMNKAGWNFGDYTEDVVKIIDELKLKNVIVVGHSMSGDILLDLSSRHPSKLAGIAGVDNLHEPAGIMNEQERSQVDSFFSLFTYRFDSVVSNYMSQYLFQPSTDTIVKQRVMQNIFNADSLVAVQVLKSLTYFAQEEKARMQKLNHKLYLVNSDVMPVKTDSLNKYCAKGVHVAYVHNTGHYPMIEKPDEFNAALQEIINLTGK